MKKLILSASFAFALLTTSNTFAQQGFGTNEPDKSAAVDIVSSKRGLLIPRISIANLDQAAPVNNPATSLFVYNTNTTSGEGFYYWDGSKWVRFVSGNTEKTVIVDEGENVQVGTVVTGNTTTYTVGVKGGTNDGQVLVTKIDNSGPDPVTTTEWVDPNDFVLDALTAGNAIGIVADPLDPTKVEVKFNGTLSENTTIATGSHDLAITGLGTVNAMTADDKLVIMDENGLLKTISKTDLVDAKTLTTDGVIVIGADSDATATTAAESVLADVKLNIGKDKITADHIATGAVTSDEILDGTIKTEDIESTGNSKVLVTAADGTVTWINQSDLGNKDNYIFTAPLNKDAGTANTTGGMDYAVTIANANATTVGVVREADTNPTVNVEDGVLSVNLTNTTLSGDVTGPLNNTKVEAIQGTDVSATAPTAVNNVLVYNDTTKEWTPTELTGAHITGAAITSTTLDIPVNTAALTALNIEITPGTADGQILTTVDNAGDLETEWATVNSLVEVDNGLNKNDTTDKIHLGGDLIEPTEIKTDGTNTLAISGLQPATETVANKVVVSEGATGILRTVERVVQGTNVDVAANSNYSFFTPEVVINVTLADVDQTITFPAAASAVGQVINIKIVNRDDTHTGYLNVLDTYGSMPYQGWIVKSNGSSWVIVGRN